MVLNHGIRMEHIAADLAAPFNLFHIAGNFRLFFFTLALLELQQFTFQHAHCRFTVLDLAALVLALYHDACRNMRNADGRFRFIDVLAAGAAATVGIHPQLVHIDLYLIVVFDHRHHIQRSKRRMTASGRIKRGNTHQPMHAFFRF